MRNKRLCFDHQKCHCFFNFFLRRSHAGLKTSSSAPLHLAHKDLWKPRRHGNIGNRGHWVEFWGQMWPPRSFGGRHGLGGCWRQYAHGYQGNQGCWFQIWSQINSKVIWSDIFTGVIEVIKHHMPIYHSPCRRRYIGPLPSCLSQSLPSRNIFKNIQGTNGIPWGIECLSCPL